MIRVLTAQGGPLGRLTAEAAIRAGWAVVALALVGCRDRAANERPSSTAHALAPSEATGADAMPGGSSSAEATQSGASHAAARSAASADRRDRDGAVPTFDAGDLRGRRKLVLERPFDLGPATALSANEQGVLFRRGPVDVSGMRLGSSPGEVLRRAVAVRGSVESNTSPLVGGPVVTRIGQSYAVARGKLLRRAFNASSLSSEGEVETLASDALDGARVAALTVGATDLVAYIARPRSDGDERRAALWSTGGHVVELSDSGAGASSVSLAHADDHVVAVWLDARAAMSPVHARTIELEGAKPRLGKDVVVFVGPSPEGHSEVKAIGWDDGVAALIPFARDVTTFGLAVLAVGKEPRLDAEVRWTAYPNGIEPAPVDSAVVCGTPWAAYVRPRTSLPDAPAVLQLAPLIDGALGEEINAGEGFGFDAVSLAAREGGGAWLAWAGNGRAWVRGVACL